MMFDELLTTLKKDYPTIRFAASDYFYWSPSDETVYYNNERDEQSLWTLLHESAHGLLGHFDFKSDFHLIKLEIEAWQKTRNLCNIYRITEPHIDYIEDCVDTYRNWQYNRSLCPQCTGGGIQILSDSYLCPLCSMQWSVTKQRFCRAYRKTKQPAIK